MGAAGGSRTYGIVAASVAAHAVLATLLVLNAPRLRTPVMQSGPPEAIIPILIMPRTPPPGALPGAAPTQVRLHRRTTRFSDQPPPVAPLTAPPQADAPTRPAIPGPKTITAPSPDDALAVNARNALRGKLSCDSATLSRAEREACMDRFADAARDAPFVGLGVNRDKAAGLDAAAARRERDYKYQRGIKPTSPPTPGAGWDTYRGPPPPSAVIGGMVGSDNVAKRIPF